MSRCRVNLEAFQSTTWLCSLDDRRSVQSNERQMYIGWVGGAHTKRTSLGFRVAKYTNIKYWPKCIFYAIRVVNLHSHLEIVSRRCDPVPATEQKHVWRPLSSSSSSLFSFKYLENNLLLSSFIEMYCYCDCGCDSIECTMPYVCLFALFSFGFYFAAVSLSFQFSILFYCNSTFVCLSAYTLREHFSSVSLFYSFFFLSKNNKFYFHIIRPTTTTASKTTTTTPNTTGDKKANMFPRQSIRCVVSATTWP